MPIYETMPDVFPPRVAPVNSMGDVPAFAFADGDAVAAWTPPDGFVFAEVGYRYTLSAPGWSKPVDVVALRTQDPDSPGAGTGLRAEVTRNVHRLDELAATPEGKIRFRREGGYYREDPGPPVTIDLAWFGRVEDATTSKAMQLRESWIFVGAEEAVQVQVDEVAPVDDARVARDVLVRAFNQRVQRGVEAGLSLWNLGLGFEMSVGSSTDSGLLNVTQGMVERPPFDDDYLQFVTIRYDVVVRPEPCDVAAARARADLLLGAEGDVERIASPSVPSHGHTLLAAVELRQPEEVWHDAERGRDEVTTARTVRVAFVAVGSAHAIRASLTIGSLAEPILDRMWEQMMERLYVTSAASSEASGA